MSESDKQLKIILDNLEKLNYDEYMNLCYNIVITFPHDIISYNDISSIDKIKSLNKLILHFEEKEQYEKCNEIKRIQSKLKGNEQ